MWPEILVCLPQRRLGDFDQFLVAKMGRIPWNPIENHDLFKPNGPFQVDFWQNPH